MGKVSNFLLISYLSFFILINLNEASSQSDHDLPILTIVERGQREKQILDNLLGPSSNYDSTIRPSSRKATHGETKVDVNMLLNSISKIDDFKMEYSVQLILRMDWNDDRLKYSKLDSSESIAFLTITDLERIWIPDIFFTNEKESSFHKMIKPNRFARIYPDGRVSTSMRISLTLSCPMDLKLFPMDSQVCRIEMSSYAWTTKDLDFQWREKEPVQRHNLALPRFSLVDLQAVTCDDHQTLTGNYSCLKVDFMLTRNFSFYLMQMYVPCVMLVITSWVSFWLDENSVPARVALGITTLLTMTAQRANMNQNLPPVSYIKALDVWSGTCLLFIFCALLEYALVNYAMRLDKRRKREKQQQTTQFTEPNSSAGAGNEPGGFDWCGLMPFGYASCSKRIDVVSRILFPAMFFIFNVIYWFYYLIKKNAGVTY